MAKKGKAETQSVKELEQIEKESEAQALPEQEKVFSISKRFSKLHNLPDPTNPPMGYEAGKGYDNVYPFVKLPFLHPEDPEDNISFGFNNAGYLDEKNQRHPLNAVYFGDNLQILRSLPSNSIDLIYIDPPFFSGRVYNQVWGDDNELRTFSDIWDGGLPSYLIWLNTRLWEMKRVLKSTGSLFIHLDWHASHYVKTELDKIFGYDNLVNEIVWPYNTGGKSKTNFHRKHDVIFWYSKTKKYVFNISDVAVPRSVGTAHLKHGFDEGGREYYEDFSPRKSGKKYRWYVDEGTIPLDVWSDIKAINPSGGERLGYPTQKPVQLLQRIIDAACPENGVVADFFMGGGVSLAVAQGIRAYRIQKEIKKRDGSYDEREELEYRYDGKPRRFIGSDISRVAVSVTLDRLVRDAEEMSGKKSSISKDRPLQDVLLAKQVIPDIHVYYHGVYPTDKFGKLSQEDFDTFVLTCFGASKNTVDDGVTGFKTQFEPILVGPSSPRETLSVERVKKFVQSVISKHIQENQRYTLTMIAWKFDPAIQEYRRQLLKNFFKKLQDKGVVLEIELIPIRSKQFRERIATTYGVPEDDKERLMQFVESPIINEIIVRKLATKEHTYLFEALAKSLNQGGKLINCQWDFDFESGNFSDPEYALRRKSAKDGFVADLFAEKTFAKPGTYKIACKVQDSYGGETIKTMEIKVE